MEPDPITRAIVAVFDERDAAGQPRWSDAVKQDAIPLLVLAGGEIPKGLEPVMKKFFEAAGITPGMLAEEATTRVQLWRTRLPGELWARIEEVVVGAAANALGAKAGALAKIVGSDVDHRPVSQRPAAPGAMRGGMATRIATTSKKPKK